MVFFLLALAAAVFAARDEGVRVGVAAAADAVRLDRALDEGVFFLLALAG